MESKVQRFQEVIGELARARAELEALRSANQGAFSHKENESPEVRRAREKDAQLDPSQPDLHAALVEAQDRIHKLSEESRQFRHLVTAVVNYAIFAMDTSGIIVSWNPGAERMKLWKAEEIIGQHLRVLYLPESRAAGLPEQHLALALANGCFLGEDPRMRKNGEVFEALISLTPIFDETGRHLGFSKVTQELTEQKKVEAERRRLTELERSRADWELKAAEERVRTLELADLHKDQFLGILSHELRTPINAIMGFASILDDEVAGVLDARQHGYVGKILGGADDLLALIDDLLDMSRIQAGKFSVTATPALLPPVIRQAAERLRPMLEERGCTCQVEVPPDLPLVLADERRVGQVLTNLLSNASKHSPQGGAITVTATVEEGTVCCNVQDQGPGIEPEDLPKLFHPFEQLDMSRTRKFGGVGLGLSIVKALVLAHGGQVGVRSAPGQGSCFWFTLPLAPPTGLPATGP